MSTKWLIRLRASEKGIVDLTGNTWNNGGCILSDGRFNKKSIKYNAGALDMESDGDLNTCSGDFTLSTWMKKSGDPFVILFVTPAGYSDAVCVYLNHNRMDGISITLSPNTGVDGLIQLSSTAFPNDDDWHHFCITRESNTVRTFIDGHMVGSIVLADKFLFYYKGAQILYSAAVNEGAEIDDFCLIDGKALWTADFTPPTGYLFSNDNVYVSTEGGRRMQ